MPAPPAHPAPRPKQRRVDPTLPPWVFLDFDGVLHPNQARVEGWFCHVDALMDVLDEHPLAETIVCSSWRLHHTLQALQALVPPRLAVRIRGVTGEALPGRWQRHAEIHAFIEQAKGLGAGPRPWCALDDCTWEFPPGCAELLPCDGARGLQAGPLAELRQWLVHLQSCREACLLPARPVPMDLLHRAQPLLDAARVPHVALLQRHLRIGHAEARALLGAYLRQSAA